MTKKIQKETATPDIETDLIKRGIQLVETMPDEAKINIKGKLYATVARRNEYFWKAVGLTLKSWLEPRFLLMTD